MTVRILRNDFSCFYIECALDSTQPSLFVTANCFSSALEPVLPAFSQSLSRREFVDLKHSFHVPSNRHRNPSRTAFSSLDIKRMPNEVLTGRKRVFVRRRQHRCRFS